MWLIWIICALVNHKLHVCMYLNSILICVVVMSLGKMQEDIRMNLMASNIVTILSVTLFVLNMCACMWYALACDNIVKGGACLNGTWATMHEPHEGEKSCCICICVLCIENYNALWLQANMKLK